VPDDRLAALAAERGAALVGYAYLLTGSVAEAEDLVQEGLVRTFARRRAGADVGWLEAYVRQAILSAFLDAYRRRRRWVSVAHLVGGVDREGSVSPDAVAIRRADVRDALATLPPRERACVVLRYFDDLSTRDVADQLGLSEGAVKRYLSNARERLGPLLDETGTETDHVDVATDGGAR
jgi:RNA polymerase sigma-70 factor (ECF subfamily)